MVVDEMYLVPEKMSDVMIPAAFMTPNQCFGGVSFASRYPQTKWTYLQLRASRRLKSATDSAFEA